MIPEFLERSTTVDIYIPSYWYCARCLLLGARGAMAGRSQPYTHGGTQPRRCACAHWTFPDVRCSGGGARCDDEAFPARYTWKTQPRRFVCAHSTLRQVHGPIFGSPPYIVFRIFSSFFFPEPYPGLTGSFRGTLCSIPNRMKAIFLTRKNVDQ